ncbi:MAG: nucleotide-binding universal stress UspA family protein [Verrucomicrobiales bacterium]|jgi:nucleotide-binding universal stress UspA family protein
MKTIVAAIDFSEHSGAVVETASKLARSVGASLEILHAVAPEPDFVGYAAYAYPGRDERAEELHKEKRALQEIVHGLRADGVEAKAFMKEAPTADGIVEFAAHHHAELLVIGTHSKGLLKRLFVGSTAQAVISRSHIPVLVVPPKTKDD